MSILIKGMDKPTDCGLCPFEDFGYCNVKGERNTSESGVDADCPLIEVADRKTEPTSSKMEQVDKDINVRSKTEPQTKCYLRTSCDHYGDKQVCGRCREYNLYSHTKDEPQTEDEILHEQVRAFMGIVEQTEREE